MKPLYEKLINDVKDFDYSKVFFCMQWGRNYPKELNTGLMFVGRATNGWISDNDSIEDLFGDGKEAIFDRRDQMQWVENLEGNTEGYNTRNSAFWRVIKGVSQKFYPKNWSSYVAWSNVCKVAPWEGNPSDPLYYVQIGTAQEIFEAEVSTLSPRIIIMLTGQGWAYDILTHMNGGVAPRSIRTET